MERIHNTKDKNLVMDDRIQAGYFKPKGLWYGINNAWLDWCKEEMPDWVRPYNYILELDTTKMLILTNSKETTQFHNEYKTHPFNEKKNYYCYIDWKKVSEKYGGIEINPYLWDIRFAMDSIWYSGWDCASGCIWNKDVILNFLRKDRI